MIKKQKERRTSLRYDTKVEIYFNLKYDLKTKIDFHIIDDEKEQPTQKYAGFSKNVSSLGISFSSDKEVVVGHILALEVYLPESKEPLEMIGEVKWCKENYEKFDAGLKLLTVEGYDVEESLNFDETYKIEWSIVLERILGDFKKFSKNLI